MKSIIKTVLFTIILATIVGACSADQSDMNKKVLAPTFVVFDLERPDNYIYAKKPDMKIMPASTTKIMTCILALESCPDLNVIVPVPDTAVKLKSTNTLMGLKRGESLPLIDLLYGMMLPSGNDAAITVATFISGSVDQFAELMNQKATELKMENTHFTNASGVYNGQHYSTARDMGKLAAYALKNPMFRKIVSTAEYDVPGNEFRKNALHLVNTNRLVSDPNTSDFYYEYAIGCKTGSTEKGGKCLVAAAEKDGVTLVAVLLGVKDGGDKSTRIRRCFSDAKMMFKNIYDTMYHNYSTEELGIQAFEEDQLIKNATKLNNETGLLKCKSDFSEVSPIYISNEKAALIQNNSQFLQKKTEWFSELLNAPVSEGAVLGQTTFSYLDTVLYTIPLKATRSVKEYTSAEDITPSPAPTPEVTPTPIPSFTPEPVIESSGNVIKYAVFVFTLITLILIVLLYILLVKKQNR